MTEHSAGTIRYTTEAREIWTLPGDTRPKPRVDHTKAKVIHVTAACPDCGTKISSSRIAPDVFNGREMRAIVDLLTVAVRAGIENMPCVTAEGLG